MMPVFWLHFMANIFAFYKEFEILSNRERKQQNLLDARENVIRKKRKYEENTTAEWEQTGDEQKMIFCLASGYCGWNKKALRFDRTNLYDQTNRKYWLICLKQGKPK